MIISGEWVISGDTVLDNKTGLTDAELLAAVDAQREVAEFTDAVQAHLDAACQARGYDSMLSCASYAVSANPVFRAEADAAVQWRDAVWGYYYTELGKVQQGARAAPGSVAAFIAELPAVVWP